MKHLVHSLLGFLAYVLVACAVYTYWWVLLASVRGPTPHPTALVTSLGFVGVHVVLLFAILLMHWSQGYREGHFDAQLNHWTHSSNYVNSGAQASWTENFLVHPVQLYRPPAGTHENRISCRTCGTTLVHEVPSARAILKKKAFAYLGIVAGSGVFLLYTIVFPSGVGESLEGWEGVSILAWPALIASAYGIFVIFVSGIEEEQAILANFTDEHSLANGTPNLVLGRWP